MRFHYDVRPIYANRAGTLLQSWICGDTTRLQAELYSTIDSRWSPVDDMDRYRLELLKVVARGMLSCSNLYAQRAISPDVGIYLDILQLLSTGGYCAGKATNGSSGPRLVKRGI